MDQTAGPILEIGVLLLGAVVAGWLARRVGLPAVVGYLVLGMVVSPFTPGYVADHDQLQLLADLGVVLLLFEVGIEVDVLRIRTEQRGLIAAAPAQTVITTAISGVVLYLAGLEPIPAALIGLSIALSSSVVIVNITKSRRRTTDRLTEQALLGWSALQDTTGVTIAAVLLALLGSGGRPLGEAALGLVAFLALTIATARLLPIVLRALRTEHDLFLIVSVASGLALAGFGSAVFGVPLALAAFVGGLAVTESAEAAEARRRLLPFRDLFAVLFFVAIGTLVQPEGGHPRLRLAGPVPRPDRRRQGGRGVRARPGDPPPRPAGAARDRSGPGRRVLVRPRLGDRRRRGDHERGVRRAHRRGGGQHRGQRRRRPLRGRAAPRAPRGAGPGADRSGTLPAAGSTSIVRNLLDNVIVKVLAS